jgi:glutamate N-acetyltransferase/amino-acid N-acetyltransferase
MELLQNGSITSPNGFLAAATSCGLKDSGALDLALVFSETDSGAAALFTQNQFPAAPVIVDKKILSTNPTQIRGIVANAGQANACTGPQGLEDARSTQRLAATSLGCDPQQILLLSTGVIGETLEMDKITKGITDCNKNLSPDGGLEVAQAIMTTDTQPKHGAYRLTFPNGDVTIGGMAKGSGMIHPNMATLLAVITTDAQIAQSQLKELLRDSVNHSFNRISIDGDTSTNDTALLLANGASGVSLFTEEDVSSFAAALNRICLDLAHAIVRDGEGASRFVTLNVTGAHSELDALQIAQTIATSPLVKTAIAGGDANWGRILAAVGRAGVTIDPSQVNLFIGYGDTLQLELVHAGTPTTYDENVASEIFNADEITIEVILGPGAGEATYWTCDLTHDYVSINADYRT